MWTRALNKNHRPSNTVSLNKFHVMQLGASKYSVNLSICSFLSLSKFCVLAPSDVMLKHTKQMKTQTKLAQLGTFCVFSLSFLMWTMTASLL